MAKFNPEIAFNVPNLDYSRGQAPNRAGEAIGAGLAGAIEGGVAAYEAHTESKIESDLTQARDQLFSEFGVTGLEQAAQGELPTAVKATQAQFTTLQAQLQQGAITPTQFYTRAGALASQVRAKYPKWRPEIDKMTRSIFGFDPANQIVSEIFSALDAANSSTDATYRRLDSDLTSDSAKKFIGSNTEYRVLFNQFQSGDIDAGKKLQRDLMYDYGRQGDVERELKDIELRGKRRGNLAEEAGGFITEELSYLRQRALANAVSAGFRTNGQEPSATSLFSYLQSKAEGGLDDQEVQDIISIIGSVKANYRTLVDDLGSQQLEDSDGRMKTVRQIMGKEFNALVESEIAQLDNIIEGVTGGKIDIGPLVANQAIMDLAKSRDFRRYYEENPQFRAIEFLRETMGEDMLTVLNDVGITQKGSDLAEVFANFLILESAKLAGGQGDIGKATSDVLKARGLDKDKAAKLTQWYSAIGKIAAGETGDPAKARSALEGIAALNPSEFFQNYNDTDSSRVQVLQRLANPAVTQFAAKNFKGTPTWERYKNFIISSFGQLPNTRNATSDFRAQYEKNRDRLDFTFDEKTFSFDVNLKDPRDAAEMGGVLARQKRVIGELNKYFAILEPIHEAEGEDAGEFLFNIFDALRIDGEVIPMIEDMQGSLSGDDSTLEEQTGTHSPNTDVDQEALSLRNSNYDAALAAGDVGDTEAYIRKAAEARGIDPDVAVRVAKSEGLAPGVWQSNYAKGGVREPSYGPFQLLVGGGGTGYPTGLGNAFMQATGLDPSDPATIKEQIDFALDKAREQGWSPWYGAAKVGVGKWTGINDA